VRTFRLERFPWLGIFFMIRIRSVVGT